MQNVVMKVEGDVLHIAVDLKATRKASASGKTEVVASTNGNAVIPGAPSNMRLGLNLFAYKEGR